MFKEENRVALSKLSKEQCVHFCVHVAKSVLHVWEEKFPEDNRPRKAIEAAEHWLIDKNTNAAANAANAAHATWDAADAAADTAAADAARAAYGAAYAAYAAAAFSDSWTTWTAVYAAARAGASVKGKWEWISKLYSSIHKEQPFPQNWKTRDTISIAKDMLTSKNLNDMPILADALEDAGCQDHEILYHLRNDEGLWTPVDWVLVNLGG